MEPAEGRIMEEVGRTRQILRWFLPGLITGSLLMAGAGAVVTRTSENSFCDACHIHPNATSRWKRSVHYDTKTGTRTGCVECHLPPRGQGYLAAKVKTGARDVWGLLTKAPDAIDWDAKSQPEYARRHVYESSCVSCHENLFPATLSEEGDRAHLYYTNYRQSRDLHCINCHLNAGH